MTTIDARGCLLDTGVLLRIVDASGDRAVAVGEALARLDAAGVALRCGTQNVAEFWNAATRPTDAHGFGLTPAEAGRRLVAIERRVGVLADAAGAYPIWKRLVVQHAVRGKQVHDCRLVALMVAHDLRDLLTLNAADFYRYEPLIRVHTPDDIVAAP